MFFACLISFSTLSAQESESITNDIPLNYKKRNAVYDFSEKHLNNTDTIPDFATKTDKLRITGTIYQSDGKTPASDVILFIHHADENGNYELKKDENRKRYIHHRGWIKTDADGQYTFYTFIPGKFLRSKELKQIHRTIKEPGKPEYEITSFFFDDDPLLPDLTLACRAKAVMSMLKLNKEENMYVAKKDIVLKESIILNQ
ncbi:hypothetical protein [Thalassobellus suaedae]|uniref:Intradiol ring-cleavage dioxygenases domain-containing protein n=1 Tax=Thalassobellus suaedae TaxID=3074124 RepID=A0ABY9XWN6_9FLAO|nr:hypothetical protein RHP51_06535 [Flavobacteriaceae bacterium HL-DH14]